MIKIDSCHLNRFPEISISNTSTIVVVTSDSEAYRITAELDLKMAKYFARCEKRIALKSIENETTYVWVNAEKTWAEGETIDDCLNSALGLFFYSEISSV